jgi:hypothetical protein
LLTLIGVDKDLEQVYRVDLTSSKDVRQVALDILKNTDHVHTVLVFQASPSVKKLEGSFMIRYDFSYLMGVTREVPAAIDVLKLAMHGLDS